MMLNACSTPPEIRQIIRTKTEYVFPPDALMAECQVRPVNVETNRDLVVLAVKRNNELMLCNLEKKALREWRNSFNDN